MLLINVRVGIRVHGCLWMYLWVLVHECVWVSVCALVRWCVACVCVSVCALVRSLCVCVCVCLFVRAWVRGSCVFALEFQCLLLNVYVHVCVLFIVSVCLCA